MSDKINDMIDEAITQLSDDNIKVGAESLLEVAREWAKAGLSMQSFLDIRKYIITEAISNTSTLFIKEKLQGAETLARQQRSGSTIIH